MSDKLDCYAIVEVLGRRVFAGRVTEQVIAGAGFIRVDVPAVNQREAFTKFIGAGSIYSITPVTEEVAKQYAEQRDEEPVVLWGANRALPVHNGDDQDPEPAF